MIFTPSQESIRRFFVESWQKFQNGEQLSAMEKIVAQILIEHPDYQPFMKMQFIDKLFPEFNPFLEISLRLALLEQLSINSPPQVTKTYKHLLQRLNDKIKAQDIIVEVLRKSLKDPDPQKSYVSKLSKILDDPKLS